MTLVAGGVTAFYALWVDSSPTGPPLGDLLHGMAFYSYYIGATALVSTTWVILPLGALGGAIYERTQTLS